MALNDPFVRIAALVTIDTPSGTLRVWTGKGPVAVDGNFYVGAFPLLSLSPIQDDASMEIRGVKLTLSAASAEIYAAAVNPENRSAGVVISFVELDEDFALVGVIYEKFVGTLDEVSASASESSFTLEVGVESWMIGILTPRPIRYTQEDHAARYPGDRSFEFTAALATTEINWGESRV